MKPGPTERLLPQATPESAHFWEGTKQGELRLQKCASCSHTYFPPQAFCPSCLSDDVAVVRASGRGRVYGFNISHLPAPGLKPPFVIAVIELEEGPRMMSNIVECAPTPDAVQVDMPVQVVFEKQSDDVHLPLFRPAETAQ